MDILAKQKLSARNITLEALVIWINNGTVKWLDGLDQETKDRYMEAARAHTEAAI